MSVTKRESILRRGPHQDRRSFVARAMGLSPIGDIAGATLSEQSDVSLTWETSSDWDNRASEDGVAHESVANTDHNDETFVRKGYNYTNPYKSASLLFYLPFHEDSGSTAYDITGNRNGTYSGHTLGNAGVLGDTAPEWGTEEVVSMGTGILPTNSNFTVDFWVRPDFDGGSQRFLSFQGDISFIAAVERTSTTGELSMWDGNWTNTGATIPDLTWSRLTLAYDDTNTKLVGRIDGSQVFNIGFNIGSGGGSDVAIGRDDNSGNNSALRGGRMADFGVWSDYFTSTNTNERGDPVNDNSTLTTGTKSFGSAQKVDLQNLSYTLNGGTITLDVIGSPGTASEEVVSQTLDGATSYSLSWSNSHTDFRVRINESVSAATATTPTVDRVELVNK